MGAWRRLFPLVDADLAGFESRGESFFVAVGDRTSQRVLFGRAFQPAEHHVSGGEPAARYLSAGQLALLEGDAEHPGRGLGIQDLGVPGREEGTRFLGRLTAMACSSCVKE